MSLIAHFPLDEDSGSTAVDIVGSNDGTINGASVGQTGVHGTAYSFDGQNDYVEVPVSRGGALDDLQPLTICAWVKFDSADSFVAQRFSWNGGTDIQLWRDFSGRINFRVVYDTEITAPSETGVWYHVAGVVTDSEVRLYVNGVEEGAGSTSTTSGSNDEPWLIGTDSDSSDGGSLGNWMDGKIDDVRFYDRALTAEEVAGLYAGGVGPGVIRVGSKSFSEAGKPDLSGLSYTLDGGSIHAVVIGSPGTASEERVGQALDGSSSYTLSWANSHTDFAVKAVLTPASPTSSPTVDALDLVREFTA